MSTVVHHGFKDLTGEHRGTLLIEGLASRHPVRWRVRCANENCRLTTIVDHVRLQNGAVKDCPNPQCKRPTSAPRSVLATTGIATPAVRTRDSDAAREFRREPPKPQIRWAAPTAEALRNADPDVLRHYLDDLENR